jgi:tRNASer (uridine44-2'-O)-methyltransferase
MSPLLSCGNGLLVHILTLEGYAGAGIDVRARQSWATYDAETQSRLHVAAVDPTSSLVDSTEPWWQPGAFLVANHADELTPWTPVLATTRDASGYLSIPCCAWAFDERFQREAKHATYGPWSFLFDNLRLTEREHSNQEDEEAMFVKNLGLGGDANATASGYSAYRIWLAKLALACGWNVECETLRIPSTRNWAILGQPSIMLSCFVFYIVVGRERIGGKKPTDEKMERLIRTVQNRGLFKTRRPEGKAGDH